MSKAKVVDNTGKFQIEYVKDKDLDNILHSYWTKHAGNNNIILQNITIIAVYGCPGCGKTTTTSHLLNKYKLSESNNINCSQLCSQVMKQNNGVLVDKLIYECIIKSILNIYNKSKSKIIIIDSFLRKTQHVLFFNFLWYKTHKSKFYIFYLNVNQNISVKRQLKRGKNINMDNNDDNDDEKKAKIVKKSDLNKNSAINRYQKYSKFLYDVTKELRNVGFKFRNINANKEFDVVCKSIDKELKYQNNYSFQIYKNDNNNEYYNGGGNKYFYKKRNVF